MKNVPQLRFAGFEGEWEEKKLSDLVKINSGKDYKHLEDGLYPVYGTGGLMTHVNEFLSEHDSIGIGRKGTINRPMILKAPFWTVDTLFFATPNKDCNLYYIFGVFQRINWLKYDESTGLPSLSKSNINNIRVTETSIEEQEKIGELFRKIDALIEKQEGKVSKLEDFKKSMLQKIFPKKGELIPEFRFSGFDGEWNLFKLNELQKMKVYQPQTITSEDLIDGGKFRVFGANDYIGYYNDYNHEKSQVTICCRGASVGNVNYVEPYTWITGNSMVLNVDENDKINKNYLYYYLKNTRLDRFITGSGQPQITREGLSLLEIKLTDLEEQQKIGQFFKNLDTQIKTEEKLLVSYKQMKKSLLQKMFV
ncbi:restriction endonuclease subunit S [Anaerococcus sp. Marseille-P9784]|uniref:restriction endonuclease subunit S n=1 Tax=Anaerococcus sp. Marseille-P9784 TaxID=2614127 RepID=UPI00124AD050|nr:restriction endonuclease subunit S [Anaerococcus sp. Marseille-P9784]